MENNTPVIECYVHGCTNETNCMRHRYCTNHSDECMKRAEWIVPFGKHKGKTWKQVLVENSKYVWWVLYKAGMFDTVPQNPHYQANRITRAYLENELFSINLA
jgi:hypothetical protein